MNALKSIVFATTCALASIGAAHAAQITGDLNFLGGDVTVRNSSGAAVTNLADGTRLDFSGFFRNTNLVSFSGTGAIGAAFPQFIFGVSGTGTIQDLTYAPFSGPVNNFFRIEDFVGNDVLRFDLSSVISSVVQNAIGQSLTVNGTGTLHLTGYDATPGTWSFTTQIANGMPAQHLTWSSNTAAVPVPGVLALMGVGLVGAALSRRRQG